MDSIKVLNGVPQPVRDMERPCLIRANVLPTSSTSGYVVAWDRRRKTQYFDSPLCMWKTLLTVKSITGGTRASTTVSKIDRLHWACAHRSRTNRDKVHFP